MALRVSIEYPCGRSNVSIRITNALWAYSGNFELNRPTLLQLELHVLVQNSQHELRFHQGEVRADAYT